MTETATDVAPTPSTTATLRSGARRALFWVVIAVIALLAMTAGLLLAGNTGSTRPLDAASASPSGAKAVAQVLREHGVDVVVAGSFDQAVRAIGDGDSATLLLYDPSGYLDEDQLTELGDRADHLVLPQPTFTQLRELAPSVALAGSPASGSAALAARCPVPVAQRAATMSGPATTYRVDGDGYTGCFPAGGGAFGAVFSGNTSVIGSTDVFDNEHVTLRGNAALALGTLGAGSRLVWYLPTPADIAGAGAPTLSEITPGWLTPLILLLVVVTIAAAIWRGRRFGALVVEDLPVVVRSEETMEGRARLYQRSSARLRALDALRVGTVQRLARSLGLSRTAALAEVAEAAAAAARWDRGAVYAVLVGAVPGSDAELMSLSRRLSELESAVASAGDPRQQNISNGEWKP